MTQSSRRRFLSNSSKGLMAGAISPSLFHSIVPASAAEATVDPSMVRFRPEIEPVVRWIEETPSDNVIGRAVQELKNGLPYRELLAALLLAGIRNIQPRPVGFKFHAVLVINSAHQLSLDAPQKDRLFPLLWALDDFKSSQRRDEKEGDWWLGPPNEPKIPKPSEARSLFHKSMENWDVEGADAAITGLCRCAGAAELAEALWPYGARNYRNIGHHIIFNAQSFRVLQTVGFQHAEPVLRSLIYGILAGKQGEASSEPFESNRELAKSFPPDWEVGRRDPEVSASLLAILRTANERDAAKEVKKLLDTGIAPESLWDGVLLFASELLMNHPGILALHAWTSCNSLHFAFRESANPTTRSLMILQAASWMTKYRDDIRGYSLENLKRIDRFEPGEEAPPLESIFEQLGTDRFQAAQGVLAYAQKGGSPDAFMDIGRRLVFEKGTNAHDYKFSAAAFEEFPHVDPKWRPHVMAASLFNLRASTEKDSPLSNGIREALATL